MPIWFRRILVVLITIFTLGYINPSTILNEDSSKEASGSDHIDQENKNNDLFELDSSWESIVQTIPHGYRSTAFIDYTLNQAIVQANEKFGPKISERIGGKFEKEILPSLESAVQELSSTLEEEEFKYLVISDDPASGYGEKIFHIYDGRTNKDLFRFHVRRENPPLDGHWFSFHYHKSDDRYREHYSLGKLYWDKNTPPKWKIYS